MDSFIPDDYVASPAQKLALYKKIGLARTEEAIDQVLHEMKERYGPAPEESENLVDIARLRIVGASAGLEFIGQMGGNILFRPAPDKEFTSMELAVLSDTFGKRLRLETERGIRLVMPIKDADGRDMLGASTEVVRYIAALRSEEGASKPIPAK